MGLDMFAYTVKSEDVVDDFSIKQEADHNEIKYWRKHHDLHGWMERLYRDKGGEVESFNCVKLRLYEHDLDYLEADVMTNQLPQTRGFFFGTNPPDADSIAEDLEFIKAAREAIADGFAVYYDSWW
jgi:hypothetical protein